MIVFIFTGEKHVNTLNNSTMKALKHIAAGLAALMILSSCSVLKNITSSASDTGSSTGGALAALYQIFKAAGGIDLGNLTNIINIGKILTGANSLANATQEFTSDFASGLIEGSSKLVNKGNVDAVMAALKALNNLDTSTLTKAADAAAQGTAMALTSSSAGVSPTINELTNILKLL